MKSLQIWDVDRLVAAKILTDLGIEATEDTLDAVARHAADHRQETSFWAARRVQSALMNRLSDYLQSIHRDHRAEWYDGYREAEACLATTSTGEALQIAVSPPPTVAGIVRGKIRQARSQGSHL